MQKLVQKKFENKSTNKNSYELMLEYANYIKQRKLFTNKKFLFDYKGNKIPLTKKQISVLKLIGKGYSNIKIAKELLKKENSVKLFVYRLIIYFEKILNEQVDRFSIIIIAQDLKLEDFPTN